MKALCARKKRLAAAVGLILAAGLGYAAWVRATGLGVPCPFHVLTGLYCPGCGITRCLSALLQGSWQTALRSNAAIVALAPFFVWLGWAAARGYLASGSVRLTKRQNVAVYAAIAVLAAFGVARNLPAFWFLRPPA
jgi:hypothetical protein